MNYSFSVICAATCLVRILGIIAIVAIVAYVAKRRFLFFGGVFGSFLGLIIPQRKIYVTYHSAEAAYMGSICDTADHVLAWGIAGAILGAAIAYALTRWIYQEDYQQRRQARENAAVGDQPADDE